MLTDLFEGYPPWLAGTISLAVALAVSYLVAETAARLVRVVFVQIVRGSSDVSFTAPIVRRPIRLIRRTVFALVAIVLLFPALKVAGVDLHVGFEPEAVAGWLLKSGVRIALIVLFATLVVKATNAAVERFVHDVEEADTRDAFERAKRVRTLGTLIENAVAVLTTGSALLMALKELNVDILPLLTGAGIVGLAVGFGAQTLVKDVISGFFMILENQVRVGDVAVINGTGGVVETMHLRTMTLRDLEGTVHVFPNGSINTLANRTKDYAYAVLDVGVGYREDTDRVSEVLRAVGDELRADPDFQANILEPLEILGVDALAESSVTIKIRMKTLPQKQWEVARQLRRRIKKAFDARGIEIPFPQRTLHVVGEARERTPRPE